MERWPLFVALFVVAFLIDFFLLLIIWEELGGQPGVHSSIPGPDVESWHGMACLKFWYPVVISHLPELPTLVTRTSA